MNRLILVGNGFDLAHGLKTSYNDFIDDFWKTEISIINSNEDLHTHANDYYYFDVNEFIQTDKRINNYKQLYNYLKRNNIEIIFENKFLKTISEKTGLQNWIDIENEYYKNLKKILFSEPALPIISESKIDRVIELNSNFEEVKNLLENYLTKIYKSIKNYDNINKNIQSIFFLKDIESKYQSEIIKLIINNTNHAKEKIKDYPLSIQNFIESLSWQNSLVREKFVREQIDEVIGKDILKLINLYPTHTILLNFNYTDTTKYYIEEFDKINGHFEDYNISEIHIHGQLNKLENPIIFGFGDDVDKKYQEFEDLNDNRYLENFKSIAYLQTDNYKKLLEFIDSEEYQVFIFGHSCGISDRTMLNTIFEHDNCKSIKPFYHKKEDGTDNYTEIVQNISRNFNDKKKYRDRVVNKTYCEPLT